MKEIVNKLHENRQVELAKSILESKGYKVSKRLNESHDWMDLEDSDGNQGYDIVHRVPKLDFRLEDDVFYCELEKEDFNDYKDEILRGIDKYRVEFAGTLDSDNPSNITVWYTFVYGTKLPGEDNL